MSGRVTLAVTLRVLSQLRRDPRTIALIVVVPCVLETLLKELFAGSAGTFQHIGAPLLGLFPFITMFLVTSITMLRERTSGTLERLMTLPLAKLDLLAGYGLAFGLMAAIQAAAVSRRRVRPARARRRRARAASSSRSRSATPCSAARSGSSSARSRSRSSRRCSSCRRSCSRRSCSAASSCRATQMAAWLRWLSDALPLTYAYDALAHTATDMFDTRFAIDVAVVGGCIALALALGAATLRRRTA